MCRPTPRVRRRTKTRASFSCSRAPASPGVAGGWFPTGCTSRRCTEIIGPRRRRRARLMPMASVVWDDEIAQVYDETAAAISDPAVLEPIVEVLADLAQTGAALEFAVGTGRVALPLAARG